MQVPSAKKKQLRLHISTVLHARQPGSLQALEVASFQPLMNTPMAQISLSSRYGAYSSWAFLEIGGKVFVKKKAQRKTAFSKTTLQERHQIPKFRKAHATAPAPIFVFGVLDEKGHANVTFYYCKSNPILKLEHKPGTNTLPDTQATWLSTYPPLCIVGLY